MIQPNFFFQDLNFDSVIGYLLMHAIILCERSFVSFRSTHLFGETRPDFQSAAGSGESNDHILKLIHKIFNFAGFLSGRVLGSDIEKFVMDDQEKEKGINLGSASMLLQKSSSLTVCF